MGGGRGYNEGGGKCVFKREGGCNGKSLSEGRTSGKSTEGVRRKNGKAETCARTEWYKCATKRKKRKTTEKKKFKCNHVSIG